LKATGAFLKIGAMKVEFEDVDFGIVNLICDTIIDMEYIACFTITSENTNKCKIEVDSEEDISKIIKDAIKVMIYNLDCITIETISHDYDTSIFKGSNNAYLHCVTRIMRKLMTGYSLHYKIIKEFNSSFFSIGRLSNDIDHIVIHRLCVYEMNFTNTTVRTGDLIPIQDASKIYKLDISILNTLNIPIKNEYRVCIIIKGSSIEIIHLTPVNFDEENYSKDVIQKAYDKINNPILQDTYALLLTKEPNKTFVFSSHGDALVFRKSIICKLCPTDSLSGYLVAKKGTCSMFTRCSAVNGTVIISTKDPLCKRDHLIPKGIALTKQYLLDKF
jgi:hypothetical protein